MNAPDPIVADVDFGTDPLEDLYERFAALRQAGHRIVPVRYIGEIAWLVLGYDEVMRTFADEGTLPAADAYERTAMPAMGRILMAMRGQQHRFNRMLAGSALLPGAIRRASEFLLVPVANDLIDAFGDRRTLDLVTSYCRPYPFRIISRLLGVPVSDEAQLLDWLDRLIRLQWDEKGAMEARAQFDSYMKPLIAKRRNDPGEDLISQLVIAELEGRHLDEEEILAFLRLLYPAGAGTTFLSMGALLYAVLSDRELYETLMAHPERRAAAVEEALRKEPPAGLLPRFATKPVTIAGVNVPAGSMILLATGAANRDHSIFPDPEKFSLEREQAQHATFGRGPHFCLGSHLAREELKVSFTLLLERLAGLRLAEEGIIPSSGTVVRGIARLPVAFDALLPARDYFDSDRGGRA
jgi:cytochrome P450